ncbi:hypothetical protein RUND412_002039 [Rhizina undulata]
MGLERKVKVALRNQRYHFLCIPPAVAIKFIEGVFRYTTGPAIAIHEGIPVSSDPSAIRDNAGSQPKLEQFQHHPNQFSDTRMFEPWKSGWHSLKHSGFSDSGCNVLNGGRQLFIILNSLRLKIVESIDNAVYLLSRA